MEDAVSGELEQRVVELEIRYTHQEELLRALDDVVREQRTVIDRLVRAIEDLRAAQAEGGQTPPHDEQPPHY